MPRLLGMISAVQDANTTSNRKRFCTRLACVGAVMPHQKTAHCGIRKFQDTQAVLIAHFLRSGPQHLEALDHSVHIRHDVKDTAR